MRRTSSRIPGSLLLVLFVGLGTSAFAGVNSWTFTGPEGGPAQAVAFHPAPGVVLALSGPSIYRSTDGAASWTEVRHIGSIGIGRILVDPSNPSRVMVSGVNALYRSDDAGLSFGAVSPPGSGSTSKLASPADGRALYVASGANDSKIFRSADFGQTWQERTTGLTAGNFVIDLVVDPQFGDTLYALLEPAGLFRTTDAGMHWTLVNPLNGLGPKKLAIDPAAPLQMLLATVNGGLLASTSGGALFTPEATAPGTAYAWVGYTPAVPRVGAAVAVPYSGAVLRRSATGQTWGAGAYVRLVTVSDGAFDPADTDPVDSTLLLAVEDGPLLSKDAGQTFEVRSQGLRAAGPYNLASARDTQGTMYATFRSGPIGVHRRDLSGWQPVNNAALRLAVVSMLQPLALAVDPVNPATLLLSSNNNVVASFDGGQSWASPNADLFGRIARSMQFAPSNPQVVYVGVDPGGVYRSDNHAVTFFPRSTGLPTGIGVIAVDPAAPYTVFAAAAQSLAAPLVYKTTDGGATWAAASTGINVQAIVSLAIDPTNTQIVYAGGLGTGEGLFKSTNGGQSWARVGAPAGDDPAFAIAIDPVVPTTIVAAINSNGGGSRSVDGGGTWEALPPAPNGRFILQTVALDPLKPSNIVVAADSYGLVELEVAPDLGTTFVAAPPASLALGGAGAATVRVTNRGPFAASAVVLTLRIPAGTTAPLPTPTKGTCVQAASAIDCSFGPVRTGEHVDTVVALTAGASPAQGTLTASVAAHESDPAFGDNSVSAAVATARVADLGVALAASAAAVDHHAPVTLTATASNAGPNASSAAQVVVDLGTGLTVTGATPSQGTCAQSGTTLTCALGSIAAAGKATVAMSVKADGVGALAPAAQISDAGSQDLVAGNNAASVTVTSKSIADLAVQIGDAADPVTAGQPIQYTATVTNHGPDDLTSATVTIGVTGATVTGATTPQGTCTTGGSTVTCTLGALPNGGSATVSIATTAGATGTASASASAASTGTDTATANDSATQTTTVNAPPSGGGGGGGGGGGDGPLELLALAAALLARAVARNREHRPNRAARGW